jgi:hypothetical protein
MPTAEAFATNFQPHAVPVELAKLLAFQDEYGFGGYSEGFGLTIDDKGGLRSWSEDPEFLATLLPFGQANGTGSFYALWADGKSQDPSAFPVVLFGDEGGVHVVAENVRGLLRILTYDAEPMVDHGAVSYYKDEEDHDQSDGHDDYVEWLANELGLEPVEDPASIVGAAEAQYKAGFDAWFAKYYNDE